MLERIAGLVTRSPRRVVLVTATIAVAVLAGVVPLASTLTSGSLENASWDSLIARDQVTRATGVRFDSPVVALVKRRTAAEAPGARAQRVRKTIARDPDVARTRVIVRPGRDYVVGEFGRLSDVELRAAVERIRNDLAGAQGVVVGGSSVADAEIDETVASDLARAEMLAFPVVLLLLLLIFRGVVPALLPVGLGLLTISGAALALGIINQWLSISVFALNLVAGLGLGLSVDYSLLMVARYREEAAVLGFGTAAIARTVCTAGRTIAFSAVTVAAAMASLLVFPLRFLYSMGLGGILVTLLSAVLAICVLPAVLLLAGERVGRPREIDRERAQGFWFRRAQSTMRRPGLSAAIAVALLLALGLPFLGARYSIADASALPSSTGAREVADAMQADLPSGGLDPAKVVVRAAPSSGPAVRRLAGAIGRRAGAPPATPSYLGRSTWAFDVPVRGASASDTATRELERIRTTPSADVPFVVGGQTALFVDLKDAIAGSLPLAVAILALATFGILFLLTGSVVLPIKAVLLNLLSISASLGVLVLLFQDGLLGFGGSQHSLELYQPVLLAALAFGLSTDFAVFLLSRIKGFHDSGADDVEAVSYGLQRTGRVVTAAALLFCVAIGVLATSRLGSIQQLGIGAAVAVLIDATIVRGVLVPALMGLLGRWNWWAPQPVRRLHARIGGAALRVEPRA